MSILFKGGVNGLMVNSLQCAVIVQGITFISAGLSVKMAIDQCSDVAEKALLCRVREMHIEQTASFSLEEKMCEKEWQHLSECKEEAALDFFYRIARISITTAGFTGVLHHLYRF